MSTEENKAVVRRYFEEFHNRRAAPILEQIMVPDLLEPTGLELPRFGGQAGAR